LSVPTMLITRLDCLLKHSLFYGLLRGFWARTKLFLLNGYFRISPDAISTKERSGSSWLR
jgi:hypothetical protein